MTTTPPSYPANANAIRGRLVDVLRRDLIGPDPSDVDLHHERLTDNPSRWYLAGFLAPAPDGVEEVEVLDDVGDPLFGKMKVQTLKPGAGAPLTTRQMMSRLRGR